VKKTLTAEEVAEIESKSYDAGFYQMYEITDKAIKSLRNSLDDVWAIEHGDIYPVKASALAEKLEFAIKTLEHLEEIIEDKGFEARSERSDLH
jgi:hypothetical protein